MRYLQFVCIAAVVAMPSVAVAETFIIRPDGTGDFPTIQAAVDAAQDGDVIELTDGVFVGPGNRDIGIVEKDLTIRSQSGDSTACIIDCENEGRGFYLNWTWGAAIIIEGLTITHGRVTGGESRGGAIFCEAYSSPTIRSCLFIDNHSDFVGGAYAAYNHCHASIHHCAFIGNSATDGNDRGYGGAIHLGDFSRGELLFCTFIENEALCRGGALAIDQQSSPTLANCSFYSNRAPDGSGIRCSRDAAPVMENTIIAFGREGAAVTCSDAVIQLFCCNVFGNEGGDWVGVIAAQEHVRDNMSEDPLFCSPRGGNLAICDDSPCAPFSTPNPDCDLIGAWPVDCECHSINAEGTGDFSTIQAAVDAASDSDHICMAPGTYTGAGNRAVDLSGKALTIQPWPGSQEAVVIDCEDSDSGFLTQSGEGPTTVLSEIVVANASADRGAGLYCSDASPTVVSCQFNDGVATSEGGGACVIGPAAMPTFAFCTFARNTSEAGGALHIEAGALPVLENCTLAHNGAPSGGGISCIDAGFVSASNCIIAHSSSGQAVACGGTGGVLLACCDIHGNAGGDWVGCIADQLGENGNIAEDPRFCGIDDFTIDHRSPCMPFSPPNEECGLIGAWGEGCLEHLTFTVQPDGTGDFPTIQDAIAVAIDGDTVALGEGTFVGEGNRGIDFLGKAITVRSHGGDPGACIIDCQGQERGFHFRRGEDVTAVVRDLTIADGYGEFGGGVFCDNASSPSILNCVFDDNHAYNDGGGLMCRNSAPTVAGCYFLNNASGMSGGAVACESASPTLIDCELRENTAMTGGGFGCESDSEPTLVDCGFTGNGSWQGGGGFWAAGSTPSLAGCSFGGNTTWGSGGGVLCFGGTFEGCTFAGNSASLRGGGVSCGGDIEAVFSQCTFRENSADFGGAVACASVVAGITGCTLYRNSATSAGAGLYCHGTASPTMENSIIAFSAQGEAVACDASSSCTLVCSDIFGNAGGDWIGCIADQFGVDGNISEDPMFCDAPQRDFTIHADSPCAPFSPPNPECDLVGAWPVGCGAQGADEFVAAPATLMLRGAAPNPFLRATSFAFGIPSPSGGSRVHLAIYDPAGRSVRVLVDRPTAPGWHAIEWDGRDAHGHRVPSGVYFSRLRLAGDSRVKSVVRVD